MVKDSLEIQNELIAQLKQRAGEFVSAWQMLEDVCIAVSRAHGFETSEQNFGERIALMHSELSEALEALRHGNPPDSHIPEFSGAEAEFADTVIRIMNSAKRNNWKVAEAIVEKTIYNAHRPFRHGGKAF